MVGEQTEQPVGEAHPVNPGRVVEAIRGDAEAIRTCWQAHRRWVAAIVLAHKPREVDLDDLLQDIAVTFVKRIGDLRDESALKPWLRTVAINAARAAGRKVRRHRVVEAENEIDGVSAVPAGSEQIAEREAGRRLLDLAWKLPEGYREPLLLRCVRGMSYRAISEIVGLPETTVETRIARGRRMLRDLASGMNGLEASVGDGVEALKVKGG